MKITKAQLKQIIKEELARTLNEARIGMTGVTVESSPEEFEALESVLANISREGRRKPYGLGALKAIVKYGPAADGTISIPDTTKRGGEFEYLRGTREFIDIIYDNDALRGMVSRLEAMTSGEALGKAEQEGTFR